MERMTDADARLRGLRRWGFFSDVRTLGTPTGTLRLIGTFPDQAFHSRGVGFTWEAAFWDADRRNDARLRGEVIRGRWEWRGDEFWLTATCPCGEQAMRARLTGPVDGETWARTEIAEWMARERWKRSCPHVAQWDWRAERKGIRR